MKKQGETLRGIRAAYPQLSPVQIKEAIRFERFLDVAAA
jgi:uncharacterized protein (DUF433 family)